jgi:hypothetical protein
LSKALVFYIFVTCCFFTEILRSPTLTPRQLPLKISEVYVTGSVMDLPFELEDEPAVTEDDEESEDEAERLQPVRPGSSASRMLAHLILASIPTQFQLNARPLDPTQSFYQPSFIAVPILSPMVSSQGPPATA